MISPFRSLVQTAANIIKKARLSLTGIPKMVARKIGRAVVKAGGSIMDLGQAFDDLGAGHPLAGTRKEAAFAHLIKTREKLFGRLDPMEPVPSKLLIYRPLREDLKYMVSWRVEKYFPDTGARITTYMSHYFDEDMVPDDWFAEMMENLEEDPRYEMLFEVQAHSLSLVQQNI